MTTLIKDSNKEKKGESNKNIKRLNFNMPITIYEDLQSIADEKGATMTEVIKAFLKLGIIIESERQKADTHLMIKRGDDEPAEIIMPF